MSSITTLMQNLADMRDAVQAEREAASAERSHLLERIADLTAALADLRNTVVSLYEQRDTVLVALDGGNGEPPLNVAAAG